MKAYLDAIFSAGTIDDVCNRLQSALDSLRADGYLAKLDDYYENIASKNPEEVQDWFDDMMTDEQAEEEGPLKEIHDLFGAALTQLRKLGFHRDSD